MKLNNLEQTNIIERHEYLSKTIFKKIQQAHNGIVGHSGVQKTIERLQRIKVYLGSRSSRLHFSEKTKKT